MEPGHRTVVPMWRAWSPTPSWKRRDWA